MRISFLSLPAFFLLSAGFAWTADDSASDFNDWTLSGGGRQIAPDVLEVVGDGKSSSAWKSNKPIKLQPGGFYRYSVALQSTDTDSGCLPCGIGPTSRDYRPEKGTWSDKSFYFRLQDDTTEAAFRLGQWESTGTYQFKRVSLASVIPILSETRLIFDGKKATLALGDGETIRDGIYRFNAWFNGENANIHRPLLSSNTTFNSNRWCLGNGSQVVYRFVLQPRFEGQAQEALTPPPISFSDGTIQIGICYYSGSEPGVVEISRDGETRWTELGKLDKTGTHSFAVPSVACPMESIYLRIRGVPKSNFQVDSLVLEAPLEADEKRFDLKGFSAFGKTLFATCLDTEATQGDAPPVSFSMTADDRLRIIETKKDGSSSEQTMSRSFSPAPGKRELRFIVGAKEYAVEIETHPLHRSDYGYHYAAGSFSPVKPAFWWCEADWKVSQKRPAPAPETAKPIRITAAKNDIEGFQFVVRASADKPIKGIRAEIAALEGPADAVIPADNVDILFAYYHFVHSQTDGTGLVDYWPDALPPLDRPVDVEPGRNQPIWVKVKVPVDAAPGEYKGAFRLRSADGLLDVEVPYAVHVWNFALPKENHHETAYGFNPSLAAQYHNAKTEEDRRRVVDLYFQSFADHRISIYRPTPFDAFSVKWLPDKDDAAKSKCEIDFSRYDAEMARVLEEFHFTNFTVPGHGLGSGTFHERHDPSLAGFAADTPQYKAMMTDYYTKLVTHLKEKGWLQKAYVYWFDEPGKHDYEFVAAGTARLQQYAPELARMMTLMMKDRGFFEEMEKIGTTLDIWCPVSNSFDEVLARERMAKGERFWWYVCTGPKAPYCTLFIDHPATELRIWHWQAWQRGIVGSLVWQTNYWHSGTAFPDGFQNPYVDPMGYMSGYSTPAGTKRNWGNGDGRFIYPPLDAAVPGMNDGKPVFAKPVSSIRWEMIREGVEDYEMLYLLRDLLKTKGSALSDSERKSAEDLLIVPESITQTMTAFTIDPRPLLERRTRIGEMIERLNGMD